MFFFFSVRFLLHTAPPMAVSPGLLTTVMGDAFQNSKSLPSLTEFRPLDNNFLERINVTLILSI